MTGAAIIRASAPVRLDFAGAWTDVAPFAERERGVVVNAAIELRTVAEVRRGAAEFRLAADDLDVEIAAPSAGAFADDGALMLHKAVLRWSALTPCAVRTRAAAPAGSGLGSSGALGVALVAALDAARPTPPGRAAPPRLTPGEIAETAWTLETVDAGIPGGRQDQYAAAVGGFQRLEFSGGRVRSQPLTLDADFAEALAAHTILCYTGRSRFSGTTIARVMRAYASGDRTVTAALRSLVEIGDSMAQALRAADLARVGALLRRNWCEQLRLDAGMQTPEMGRLEVSMTTAGAIGGKAAGAGTGGSMFFVVPGNVTAAIDAARGCGATVLPVNWAGGVERC